MLRLCEWIGGQKKQGLVDGWVVESLDEGVGWPERLLRFHPGSGRGRRGVVAGQALGPARTLPRPPDPLP